MQEIKRQEERKKGVKKEICRKTTSSGRDQKEVKRKKYKEHRIGH